MLTIAVNGPSLAIAALIAMLASFGVRSIVRDLAHDIRHLFRVPRRQVPT